MPLAQDSAPILDAKTEIAPSTAYPIGKTALPAIDIPVDTKETCIFVSREGWPDLGRDVAVVEIRQFYSFDGGATWLDGGASTHAGGVWTDRYGRLISECTLGISGLPDTKNPLRKMRVEIAPISPLTAKVSIEARSKTTLPDPKAAKG